MKQMLALLLGLILTLGLTACGGAAAPETTVPPTTQGPKTVSTVDDLLAAIAPNTEILLEQGDYCLTEAADYGKSGTGSYYTWNDLGGGDYELQLQNLENLTIRGAGMDHTKVYTDPRSVNVLVLENCENVTLGDMTLGHTEMAEACEGGVLWVNDSKSITLEGLGLYGCGTIGIYTVNCQGVSVRECSVYECSIGGMHLLNTRDVTVTDSSFHSLGEEMPVSLVFNIWGVENMTVSGCTISDNYVFQLIYATDSNGIAFRDNLFQSNRVAEAAFSFQDPVIMEDNLFVEMDPRSWYTPESAIAVDSQGNQLVFEAPQQTMEVTPGVATPVSTGEQKQVRVKTVDQFLQALAPDTCIILEAKLLDFSKATDYGAGEGEYYYWAEECDGPSLVIRDLSNLTILAEGEDRTAHTLSAVPRYADVLTFENCSAVTLSGFTAGHTIEPGYCSGGVVTLRNCEDVLVDNCGLYGCGTEGINAQFSRNIQVVNSEIYECSYCGILLDNCDSVAISSTVIRDIQSEWGQGNFFQFHSSTNVTLDGQSIDGNYAGN